MIEIGAWRASVPVGGAASARTPHAGDGGRLVPRRRAAPTARRRQYTLVCSQV